jgi:hypothetical protein
MWSEIEKVMRNLIRDVKRREEVKDDKGCGYLVLGVVNLIQWIKAKERALPLVGIQKPVSCILSLVSVGINCWHNGFGDPRIASVSFLGPHI